MHQRPLNAAHGRVQTTHARPAPVQRRHRQQPGAGALAAKRPGRLHTAGAGGAQPTASDAGRILQQHRALMEAGFSYDQAALILQITERRAAASEPGSQQPLFDPQPAAAAAPAGDAAGGAVDGAAAADPAPAAASAAAGGPGAAALEERVSFLEMELLKHSLSAEAALLGLAAAGGGQEGPLALGLPAGANGDAALVRPAAGDYGEFDISEAEAAAWAARAGAGSGANGPAGAGLAPGRRGGDLGRDLGRDLGGDLDPEVLAIAEALLIRRGLAPAPGGLLAPPPGGSPAAAAPAAGRGAAAPWGAGWHQRQQGRRLTLRDAGGAAPYGRGAGWRGAGGRLAARQAEGQDEDELAPYEPSGLAMAGTLLAVSRWVRSLAWLRREARAAGGRAPLSDVRGPGRLAG